jgi:hypothetical protein
MSSYIVHDETINRVVSFLYTKTLADAHYWPFRPLGDAGYSVDTKEDRQALAKKMFALNVAATRGRYPDNFDEMWSVILFDYAPVPPVGIIQTLKSLECWLYQCAEGDIPQSDLYQLFESVANRLRCEIIHEMPKWKAAHWG